MSMIGKTLGTFECTALLGKGGMGEVYKAKDQKLGRDVAIKVLPEEFAKDADRVARFQREAKLLASLNHPSIASIYGLEKSDGTHFLVLELIEGDTLADQIKKGPIPAEESLKLALQIAEALEAAHEKGVIHRDLKPANIKVTQDGKIKVLDFGLAKAFAPEQEEMILSDSPTLSAAATQKGVILGTAAYMSPEQAKGKSLDRRTDVWAFGCVLFEMLTGKAAFQGEDVTEILASVVKASVDLEALPKNVHPRVREVVGRCLQKNLRKRYAGISDVTYEIEEALADPRGVIVQPVPTPEPQKESQAKNLWIAAAVILSLIIGGVAVWYLKPSRPPEPKQVTRFEYELPEGQQFIGDLAISRDGSQFVYRTPEGLYLHSMDSLDSRLITGTDKNSVDPFFSPDGQWIGYFAATEQKLKKIAVSGGAPIDLCETSPEVAGASWDSVGTIVYSDVFGGGLKRISANGGTPESLTKIDIQNAVELLNITYPQMLPDGKTILFTGRDGIVIQSLESGKRKTLIPGAISARYLPTGHIVFYLANNYIPNLFAVPFDLNSLDVTAGRVSILEGVRSAAFSDSGTFVYVTPPANASGSDSEAEQAGTLVWVDKAGREEPLEAESGNYRDFRISPDGTRVALCIASGGNADIWIWDIVRKTMTRLTFDEAYDNMPLWTPDSKRVSFTSTRNDTLGIYWKAADGTGEVERLDSTYMGIPAGWSWSGDGNDLILWDIPMPTFSSEISMLSVEGDRARKLLLHEKDNEGYPQVSPDGRWLAYHSDESGKWQIYVRPFPDIDKGKWQISTSSGNSPLWAPNGKEIFYRSGDATMSVEVETEQAFNAGNPKVVFQGTYKLFNPGSLVERILWDLSPDGERFLMIKSPATEEDEATAEEAERARPIKINIVLNWFEELKERVPVD